MLDTPSDSSLAAERQLWAENRRRLETGPYCTSPKGPRRWFRKRLSHAALALFGALLRPTPLDRRGRRNALALRLVELELGFPHLPPAFDGYRILHLSDTHLDHFPELAPVARRLLSGLQVDMLAVTGDVQGRYHAPVDRPTTLLAYVLDGVRVLGSRVAVLGNHDPVAMADALEGQGYEVLINRSLVVERGGERLHLTGVDDVNTFFTESAPAALMTPLTDPRAFRVALVHSAE